MTAKTLRILKEARSLFWPWCAVILAAALPLLEQTHSLFDKGAPRWGILDLIEPISFLGFVLGIPLLATLSLGNEFRHRTLPLLLSQPVGRMEIWGEKMIVSLVAVLSSILVFCICGWSTLQHEPDLWLTGGAYILAMAASATFWTLFARSTMGGLALNGVNCFIPLAFFVQRGWIPVSLPTRSIAAFAFVVYAFVMLWLGRRAFARFQATGGWAGEDLLTTFPEILPGSIAGWFRSRPTGAVLNLIRKEFHLLRPVWLISFLAVPLWICLPLFGSTTQRESALAGILIIVFPPLAAVLAGAVSLGEERTSGTHAWSLTLPVYARRQWLIKLLAAMFTALVCAALLPISILFADEFISRSPLISVNLHVWLVWLPVVALLSFASFWCACAVNGTVAAALWVFPAMIALFFSGQFGIWFASGVMDFVVSKFDFFANFRITNAVSNVPFFPTDTHLLLIFVLLVAPALLLAVYQSCQLFRKQLPDRALLVVRRLLPLAITAFLCGFSVGAFYALVDHAKQQMWTLFRETNEAIEAIQPGTPKLDEAHPLQLTVEDLAKASPLSERTRRWLANSRITVAPDKPNHGPYCCGGNSRGLTTGPNKAYSWYLATIHLPSGSKCTVSFRAWRGYGILGGVCQ